MGVYDLAPMNRRRRCRCRRKSEAANREPHLPELAVHIPGRTMCSLIGKDTALALAVGTTLVTSYIHISSPLCRKTASSLIHVSC